MSGGQHSTRQHSTGQHSPGQRRSIGAKTLVAAVGADVAGAGFRSLAAGVAAAIERGDLPVGARLPSERALSTEAGCSRGTVVAAYEVLRGQGLVLRRTGSGTWVRRPPDGHVAPAPSVGTEEHAAAVRARRLTARVLGPGPDDIIDLGLSALAEPWELDDAMLRVTAADLAAVSPRHGYAPSGIDELRIAVADRHRARGLATDAEQVTITHGAQHALALAVDLLVHPGDVVVVEQPTFPGAIDVLARAGARLVTVPVDAGGTDVDSLARVLERGDVRAVYLVPTCNSATGATTTPARRRDIAALVDAAGCWLIEDEALAPLHHDGPPPSVSSQVRAGRTVTIGSLAKEVWAGVRVGWIRTDATTTEHLARLRAALDLGASVPGQLVALRCLDGVDDRTARLRTELSHRADVLCELLETQLPEWSWTRPSGGLSLWCRLPVAADRSGDGDALARRAPDWGVSVLPGSSAAVDQSCDGFVRLSFAAPADQLRNGVERLAAAWAADHDARRGAPS